ncbi:hypothetical protein HT102_05455 [Hoyosella sp. G463]|uniref:DUF3093 domain-containing protein n=1 Tax=Lolliginicoccus lacisalsi TaxID=2742202 RepID=A0A927PM03_9ACTN|nr:hypothetical protein [Lolliginicoccus lacisalsi]MBD8505927.1 hypothetical protein [Lolliginicoccus lacisalsi]
MTSPALPFEEQGARWRTLLVVPVGCLVGIFVEAFLPGPVHWLAWGIAAVLVALVLAWQIAAARAHVSVYCDEWVLRQGTETIGIDTIAEVLPPASGYEEPDWWAARALGELPTVPRRRAGIGLRLSDGSTVQAWARDDDALRRVLDELVA